MLTKSPPSKTTHPGNNFDFIRILAASMVLYSHHYSLTGQLEPSFFGIHSLGGLSVTIFFIISGYLVAASWQRDPNLWRFALRRFLRIWPALTMVIFLAAYALGPWVTRLPLNEYLNHPATAHYLRGILMNISFVLPGVFEQNPYPLGVNGSLWTIPIEVKCYIFLGLAGVLGLLKNRAVFLFCIALFMAWFLARTNADVTGVVNYPRELGAFFLAGAALHALKSNWSRHSLLWALTLGLATIAMWSIDWRHTALLIGLPFAVIYAGTHATPLLRRFGRWGDPSYGIYLFAFPVQQTVVLYCWPWAGFAGTLALSLLITVALAYASWHLLEKQALKFKPSNQPQRNDMETLRQFIRHLPMKWFWPLLAAAVGLRFIFKHLNAPVLTDPTYTYLRAALPFLDQGWAFLLTPQSYQVTPLAYLWPALWGADQILTQIANCALFLVSVILIWAFMRRTGGRLAAFVACAILIGHPDLKDHSAQVLTESLYLFGFSLSLFAIGQAMANQARYRWLGLMALGLTITLLTRPVLQYMLLLENVCISPLIEPLER